MSHLEEILLQQLEDAHLPPEREYRFHPTRKWRFDFAFPAQMVAVEVEGGIWQNGRHNRARGFEADCEKYNAAALRGWMVLRFTASMITDGTAFRQILLALSGGDLEEK